MGSSVRDGVRGSWAKVHYPAPPCCCHVTSCPLKVTARLHDCLASRRPDGHRAERGQVAAAPQALQREAADARRRAAEAEELAAAPRLGPAAASHKKDEDGGAREAGLGPGQGYFDLEAGEAAAAPRGAAVALRPLAAALRAAPGPLPRLAGVPGVAAAAARLDRAAAWLAARPGARAALLLYALLLHLYVLV